MIDEVEIADPYVPAFIEHGLRNLRIEREKLVSRSREPDTISVQFQDVSAAAFQKGSTIAGFDYMPIVDRERTPSGPVYLYRLQLEGIEDAAVEWIETDYEESETEEGWDEIHRTIFTRNPDAAVWRKGTRLLVDAALTGVTGAAATDKLYKVAHGLLTGQLFTLTFTTGFTGLISGTEYYAIRIDADNIKVATTNAHALAGTAINITADGAGATIAPAQFGLENLWIMDRSKRKHRAKGYWEITMVLKGLIAEKPYKRRYNGSPQVVSPGPFEGDTYLFFDTYVGFPPVPGDPAFLGGHNIAIEWDIPQISITDTFVTSTPPPTDKFGFWTPNDPPLVFYMPVLATEYTVHCPYGWKLGNIQGEKLAGQEMYIVSLTFGTQAVNTPRA